MFHLDGAMGWLSQSRRTKLTLSRSTCQLVNNFVCFLVILVRKHIMAAEWE